MGDIFAKGDRAIELLRSKVEGNTFDYGFALSCLVGWSNRRGVLARLVRDGHLIQLKRGFYLFSPLYRSGGLHLELIANQISGPSYVSLEWALSWYGMIPEKVYEITSVTTKRSRTYETPIGRFSYRHLHPALFPMGIEQVELPGEGRALMASREKAVVDFLIVRRGRITSLKEMRGVVLDDFRLNEEDLRGLDRKEIEAIHEAHPHSAVRYLIRLIEELQA